MNSQREVMASKLDLVRGYIARGPIGAPLHLPDGPTAYVIDYWQVVALLTEIANDDGFVPTPEMKAEAESILSTIKKGPLG